MLAQTASALKVIKRQLNWSYTEWREIIAQQFSALAVNGSIGYRFLSILQRLEPGANFSLLIAEKFKSNAVLM
jgi:hypothetical protein